MHVPACTPAPDDQRPDADRLTCTRPSGEATHRIGIGVPEPSLSVTTPPNGDEPGMVECWPVFGVWCVDLGERDFRPHCIVGNVPSDKPLQTGVLRDRRSLMQVICEIVSRFPARPIIVRKLKPNDSREGYVFCSCAELDRPHRPVVNRHYCEVLKLCPCNIG